MCRGDTGPWTAPGPTWPTRCLQMRHGCSAGAGSHSGATGWVFVTVEKAARGNGTRVAEALETPRRRGIQ